MTQPAMLEQWSEARSRSVSRSDEDEARLDAALSLLHAQDVAGAQLLLQIVDDLLQRLHLPRQRHVSSRKASDDMVRISVHGGGEDVTARGVAASLKRKLLVPQLLGRFQHVHGVVGDALEVADGLQQLGGLLAVRRRSASGLLSFTR